MFIRKKKNSSGSVSIQILYNKDRKNILLKTVGCAKTQREEELLVLLANTEMERLQGMSSLFVEQEDLVIENFVNGIANEHLQIVGPELILGRVYQKIGFPTGGCPDLFKHLVLCRLVCPGSKLKTVDYFKQHLNIAISVYSVYRFLDELNLNMKPAIEQAAYKYSEKLLKGKIGIVFYDMTTLYFEASEEDDYRIAGFSKDGKHQQPQIMIGLLVSNNGYPIGYQVFEGNTSETRTLIPVLEALQEHKYMYILGGRIKNETEAIKTKITQLEVEEGNPSELETKNGRLVVSYSAKRARKDKKNRDKGLQRLEKRVKSGKLSKEHINNRGYNKYLRLSGEATIAIDYDQFNADCVWDGLKGYVTNTNLSRDKVIENYSQLWHVEKAFRISKTDLRIRPVYHRLKNRIEAHICICFSAYAVYKELERLLMKNNIEISPEKAINAIKEIRQLKYVLPISKQVKTKILQPTELQDQLLKMKI